MRGITLELLSSFDLITTPSIMPSGNEGKVGVRVDVL